MLELEGEHGDFAHQHPATEEHEGYEQSGRCFGMSGKKLGNSSRIIAPDATGSPKEGASGGGQTDEAQGLTLIEIELSQTQRTEGGKDKGNVGKQGILLTDDALEKTEKEGGGSKTEGDTVGQGVQLLAYRTAHAEQTSGEAIEEIKDCS